MKEPVYILGGGRTDFKRNLKKEGKTIRRPHYRSRQESDEMRKSIRTKSRRPRWEISTRDNLPSSCISARFAGDRSGVARHPDDAYRSGVRFRRAFGVARRAMDHGRILRRGAGGGRGTAEDDVVLDGSDVLGAAADYHVEKPEYGDFMFPKLFGRSRRFTSRNTALEKELAWVAYKNYAHAQFESAGANARRGLTYDARLAGLGEESKRRSAAEGFRLLADHRWLRGARACFRGVFATRSAVDKSKLPRLLGFGHSTDYLALEKKDAPTFSTARKAAEKAFGWRT